MACTCVWRYEQKDGMTIGYRDSTCQDCINNSLYIEKERKRQDLLGQISTIEKGIYYSELDGDMKDETISWADFKKAQRLLLKQQLANLS